MTGEEPHKKSRQKDSWSEFVRDSNRGLEPFKNQVGKTGLRWSRPPSMLGPILWESSVITGVPAARKKPHPIDLLHHVEINVAHHKEEKQPASMLRATKTTSRLLGGINGRLLSSSRKRLLQFGVHMTTKQTSSLPQAVDFGVPSAHPAPSLFPSTNEALGRLKKKSAACSRKTRQTTTCA